MKIRFLSSVQSVSIDLTILLEAREVYGNAMSKSATLCDTINSALNRLQNKKTSFSREIVFFWKRTLRVEESSFCRCTRIIVGFLQCINKIIQHNCDEKAQ